MTLAMPTIPTPLKPVLPADAVLPTQIDEALETFAEIAIPDGSLTIARETWDQWVEEMRDQQTVAREFDAETPGELTPDTQDAWNAWFRTEWGRQLLWGAERESRTRTDESPAYHSDITGEVTSWSSHTYDAELVPTVVQITEVGADAIELYFDAEESA